MSRTLIAAVAIFTSFVSLLSAAPVLDSLAIEGLVANPASIVENNLPIKKGQTFTAADVQSAIKALFRTSLFSDVSVEVIGESDSTAGLLVKVVENPVCDNVEFKGFKKVKEADIKDKIALRKGKVLAEGTVFDDVSLIRKEYEKEGYLNADVKCDLIETKVPGFQIARFSVTEGKKIRIGSIAISGAKAFSESKLHRKFKTKRHRVFIPGEYKEDLYRSHLDSLMMFYHNEGYLDARIVSDTVIRTEGSRDLAVQINIEEGRRFISGDFYFTGNRILDKNQLQARVAMKRGRPFAKDKFEQTKGFIANAYREEGYLWVNLDEKDRFRGDTIDVTFNVVEGRPAIVRRIEVAGNDKTREKVIRRELSMYPGQKYRQSRMERSIRDAMQLNYFNNVVPDIRQGGPAEGSIDLVFKVDEKENIGQFSAGVQYSQIDKFGGNFSVSIPNFRGAGEQLSTSVEFSKYSQRTSFSFTEPWIFDSPTSFTVSPFFQHNTNQYKTYDIYSYGLMSSVGRKLRWPDDFWYGSSGYRISHEDDVSATEFHGTDYTFREKGWLSKLSLTLSRNDADLPQFPTKGSLFSITGDIAGLGGDYRFVKATVGYDMYFPLFWKTVFGVKSKFGAIGSLGSKRILASNDLFAVGGVYYDGMVRGYDDGQFGRWDPYNPGLTMAAFQTELRVPILEQQLYLAAFADMGNAWSNVAKIDFGDMYTGVGIGFRLMLPMVGLLGFDFAWGLDDPYQSNVTQARSMKGFTPHFIMNKGF